MIDFKLPEKAKLVMDMLEKNSYEAYIVGGTVRDAILKNNAHDIDITTNALPYQIIDVFKNHYTVVETGVRYGTVTVIIDNEHIEVTTYRSEDGYEDGRHPENISFERDITKDLSRRDFTINAMAYNEKEGLLDLFGGQEDLKNKTIKCVGEPKLRFLEDKLRMLRAVRFASTFDFDIEISTLNAIKELCSFINTISVERINQELTKMLLIDKPSRSIILMKETGLLKYILPIIDDMYGFDQQNPYHKYDLFFHTMNVLDNVENDIILRLSALFHDTGKLYTKTIDEKNIGHFYGHDKVSEDITRTYLKKLKYSNATINLVSILVKKHMISPNTITSKGIKKLISLIGKENIHYLVKLQKADSKSTTIGQNDIFSKKVEEVLKEDKIFTKNDLKINGYDIMELGYTGKNIGNIIDYLMDLVFDDPSLNEKDILINHISKLKL